MKKLFDFLKRIEEAEEMTADTEKVKDGIWTVNRNQANTEYEGGDYQNPRIAIMYDGTQGHNGWFWEVIEGKNVIGTSDTVFKTADNAKVDAEGWIDRLNAESDPEPDLGRIGESKLIHCQENRFYLYEYKLLGEKKKKKKKKKEWKGYTDQELRQKGVSGKIGEGNKEEVEKLMGKKFTPLKSKLTAADKTKAERLKKMMKHANEAKSKMPPRAKPNRKALDILTGKKKIKRPAGWPKVEKEKEK